MLTTAEHLATMPHCIANSHDVAPTSMIYF